MKTPDFRVAGTKLPFIEKWVEVGYTKDLIDLPKRGECNLVSAGYVKAGGVEWVFAARDGSKQGVFGSYIVVRANDLNTLAEDQGFWKRKGDNVKKMEKLLEEHRKGQKLKAFLGEDVISFQLPDRWCIKITKENQREIGEWFNSNIEDHGGNDFDYYRGYHGMYYHYPEFATPDNSKTKYVVGPDIQIGYTRITIEEFRQITGGKSAEKVFNKLAEDIQDLKTKMKKPPLGLFPRNIWEENVRKERTQQVLEAIQRYIEEAKQVPEEWTKELIELLKVKSED